MGSGQLLPPQPAPPPERLRSSVGTGPGARNRLRSCPIRRRSVICPGHDAAGSAAALRGRGPYLAVVAPGTPVRALPRPARVEAVRVSERSTKGAPVQCARTGGRAALAMLTPPAALRRAARLLMTMLLLASVLLVAGLVVQGAVFVGRQYVPVRDPDT